MLVRVKEITGLAIPDPLYPQESWNHPEWFE